MPEGTNGATLEFDAYTKDPLAFLVLKKLNWKLWRFPAVYTAASLAFFGVAILVYVVRDGGFDISKFGGYQAFIPGVAINLAMYAFGSRMYLYFSQKSGTLYQDLADAGCIKQSECKSIVREDIEMAHGKLRWPIAAVMLVLIFSAVWLYQYWLDPTLVNPALVKPSDLGLKEMIRYQSTFWFICMPQLGLGVYMIGMMIARIIITYLGLRKVINAPGISVRPLHPDKCGGLKPLLNYALSISYMMALFGLAFAVLTYSTSQVWDSSGTVSTVASNIFKYPTFWFGAPLYLIVTPAAFFGTLWTAHGPMQTAKSKDLEQLSDVFDGKRQDVRNALNSEASQLDDKVKSLKSVHELYRMIEAFSVWPFDMGSLRWFGTIFATPIFMAVISIFLQSYVFK